MLADAHTHLDFYGAEQLPQIIERAENSGVKIIIAASMDLESSRKTVSLVASYPGLFPAVGIHPWNAVEMDKALYQSLRTLASDKAVAISEIGLDFSRDPFRDIALSDSLTKQVQQQAFREQIRLAREVKLPMIIHCREAYSEMMGILHQEAASEIGGAIHGFSGTETELQDWLNLGFYISIGVRQIASLDDTPGLKQTYGMIPLNRLLLETDQDPSQVTVVASRLAELTGMTTGELGQITTDNLKRLLRISS